MSWINDFNKLTQGSHLLLVAFLTVPATGGAVAFHFFRDIFISLGPVSLVIFSSVFCLPMFILLFVPILGFMIAIEDKNDPHKQRRPSEKVPATIVIIIDIFTTHLLLLTPLIFSYFMGSSFRTYVLEVLAISVVLSSVCLIYAFRNNVRP